MGSGKTSASINLINNSSNEEKFLFITPYLTEIEKIKTNCISKKFKEPCFLNGRKLNGIKELISRGENIVSTHALFQNFDLETINLCKTKNYTLILDEVTNVIETYNMSNDDFSILKENFVDVNKETGLLKWRNSNENYHGRFEKEKKLCELNSLALYGGSTLVQLFPIDIFNSFKEIYILTYMFHSQIQKYYYDYYNIQYNYMYVAGDCISNYHFTSNIDERNKEVYDYKNLIHILYDKKLNYIGNKDYDLSKTWYEKNKNNHLMKQLKNNITNFFINKRKTKSSYNLWTTFKDYKKLLSGKGYSKGYLPLNIRASNDYASRTSIAYPINKCMNPITKNFFIAHSIEIDENGFALSEMLQFIWRSAIRNGEEIYVYIPSIRMRTLLEKWIQENSECN